MPGTRPGKTKNEKSARSAKTPEADWEGTADVAGEKQQFMGRHGYLDTLLVVIAGLDPAIQLS